MTPDLGFQIASGLTPEQQDALLSALTSSLPHGATLLTSDRSAAGLRIGAWLHPAADAGEERARGLALDEARFPAEESFGAFVSAELIRRSAQIAWYQAPQRLDALGRAQADGPIQLTGFSLELATPDRIVTTITGHDERARPRHHFELVTTDTLTADGAVSCTSRVRLDGGRQALNALSGLLQLALPAFGGAWSLQGAVQTAAQPGETASPGRSVLRLLPVEVLLPGGLKLVASYRRLALGTHGLVAAGSWTLAERRPSVAISRPPRVTAEFPDLTCMAQLAVHTADLRAPLRVSWSANGLVANPGARSTPVLFDVRGARPAQVLAKTVAVRVTDADGLTAEAQATVPIQITWAGLPAGSLGTQPVRMLGRIA